MRSMMVFVMQSDGHNPNYVQWLAERWRDAEVNARLDFVISPSFAEQRSDVCTKTAEMDGERIRIIPLAAEEYRQTLLRESRIGRLAAKWPWMHQRAKLRYGRVKEWQLCRKYAAQLGSDHILFVNFDFYQALPAVGVELPCRFSGIYHNPSYHYANLFGQKMTVKERVRAAGQRFQVDRVLRHSELHTLFLQDPFLAEVIRSEQPEARVVPLPTPARMGTAAPGRVAELRGELQIEPGRRVFLLLGGVSRRRGLVEVLHSLVHLGSEIDRQICLLLVGRHENHAAIRETLEEARISSSAQIIGRNEFVPESDIAAYYALADVVLVTHPRHVGTSQSLAYAANAEKPVLASSFGLVGALVQRHKLGLAVDARSPTEIAEGITRFVQGDLTGVYDLALARQFAQENSVENFTRVILDNMLPPLP